MSTAAYDLLVIGSGPAGQKAAIQAAKLGRRVAVIERGHMVGGVCVNTGTIPSKTLREAVVYLTGHTQRSLYGQSYRLKDDVTIHDLLWRAKHVVEQEVDVIRDQLARNHVDLVRGTARFVDPGTLAVTTDDGIERRLTCHSVVIASGTIPSRPPGVEFDERTVLDSDGILNLDRIPSSLVVVGAGVIGIEYASMFAALRTRVTVVERRGRLLDICDAEIVEALQYHLRDLGVVFRFGETVSAVETSENGTVTSLASGKRIPSDMVLYSAGRRGATDELDLAAAGLEADERGRLTVDAQYRTSVPSIFAAGDVIGFPSLAATSAEQGRLAACHAFGIPVGTRGSPLPVGIYTIPEISYVGRTEEELTTEGVPYEIGVSRYRELARGAILGDKHGMLKLLVLPSDRKIIGVHVFGSGATEVVHIGQMAIAKDAIVDDLVDTVFNYPTLAEAYKVAALDVLNRMRHLERVSG
jgi:NAD(P) transhydrogenase